MSSYLMDRLTQKLGADARKLALERHPELAKYSIEHQERIVEAVDHTIKLYGMPETAESAETAFRILGSGGELDQINQENAPPSTPFESKSGAVEEEFLRTAPIDEVGKYLQAKYQEKP
jgi:hypothetical protein